MADPKILGGLELIFEHLPIKYCTLIRTLHLIAQEKSPPKHRN